ncbi:Chitin synthase, class 5 [Irineochytrium annulatum]|nr:Chitin synthase, class 5 [Irineochytrium annulatum]
MHCRHIERLVFGVKSDHIPLLEEMEHPSWHSKKKHHSHHHRDHNGHRAIADASLSVEESKEKTALARIKRVRMKILYAYVCEPSTLAKSYLSFLLTHGGVRALQPVKAKDYLETMGLILKAAPKAESTLYRPTVESPELPPPLFESKIPAGLPVERILPYADFIDQVPHDFIMCGFQHPYTTDCERGVIRAFNGECGGEGLYFCLATGVLMTLYQDGVTTGSIINLTIERNLDEERRQRDEFLELQQSIYEHFSQVPETPEVSLRSVTQTSATIQWKPLELNAADLRGIDIYKNSQKLSLVVPPGANSAKLSGLDVSHEYEVWIVVRTSSGHYHSNHITVKTHSLENLTGINVCFGALGNDGEMSNLVELLGRIGASYTEELTTDNTHLVCSFARGPKYEKALEWNIPAVSPEFLKACEQNGKVMPSFQYYLGP